MKSKNIWIVHHYADPPDGHWTGTYELYKFLVKKGHKITVFSSSFSHYSRQDPRLKKGETYREQDYNGMRFVFIKTPPYSENDFKRTKNMVMYAIRSYLWGRRQKEKPDVIITATPHPFCAYAAYRLAKKFKVPYMLELHDLWLDYLLDTNMVHSKNPAYALVKYLELTSYKNAKYIFALWPQMHLYLEKFGIPPEKVIWTPLGIDFDDFEEIKPKPLDHGDTFTVMCTARFGPASNLQEILEAAKILKEAGHTHIRFVLIGGGPEKDRLASYVTENNLDHVNFPGMIPKEQIRKRLYEADACIAGLPDIPNYRKYGTIPTKILDYLTSMRPTIFITTIKQSLVERANAGLIVLPNQPQLLADTILKLSLLSSEERLQMGQNGMDFMKEHHNLSKLADKIDALL